TANSSWSGLFDHLALRQQASEGTPRLNIVSALGNNGKLLNWWQQTLVRGVDHDAILLQIAEDSGWSGRYAFLIVVSAAISLLGLLMPSVAVLIGAMLLSPLM